MDNISMDNIGAVLKDAGLTLSETRVYTSLLRLRCAPVNEIANDAKMHRKNTYEALEKLLRMGLVLYTLENGRKEFKAEDPSKLYDLMETKKENIALILPKLKKLYRAVPFEESVSIVKGKSGIKGIFEDILKKKEDYVTFGAEGKFEQILPIFYSQYQMKKKEAKLSCKAIYNAEAKDTTAVKEFIGEVKFIPKELHSSATTWVYGDTIAIIIWDSGPTGILIKNKAAADSYRSYFELIWQKAVL